MSSLILTERREAPCRSAGPTVGPSAISETPWRTQYVISIRKAAAAFASMAILCGGCAPAQTTGGHTRTGREGAIAVSVRPDRHTVHALDTDERCPNDLPRTPVVKRIHATLMYCGELTDRGLDALRAADKSSARTLLIMSSGGDVRVGMDFGEWVYSRKLDVVVDTACVSSCANYIFPAARRKILLPGAVVVWHGSAHQGARDIEQDTEHSAEERNKARNIVYPLRDREAAFFTQIGVSECITRFGIVQADIPGPFTMSAQDMRRFGITNVQGGPSSSDGMNTAAEWIQQNVNWVSVPPNINAFSACP